MPRLQRVYGHITRGCGVSTVHDARRVFQTVIRLCYHLDRNPIYPRTVVPPKKGCATPERGDQPWRTTATFGARGAAAGAFRASTLCVDATTKWPYPPTSLPRQDVMERAPERMITGSPNKPVIAVVGAGLMGHGIAQLFAVAGHRVAVYDPNGDVRASVPARVRSIFELLGQDQTALERISLHSDFGEAVSGADFVFEAAPEKLEIKQEIFERLAATTKPVAVLASNTSVIPIGDLGARVNRQHAGRIVGTHFWNPPHLVPLVEVVQAERTDVAVVEKTVELLKSVGKVPVHVKRDIPGFIGNRLQHALKREAIALVADGVCDAETIDLVVKHGFGSRLAVLGPMEQSDLVGLDLTLDIHKVLLRHLDRRPGPHPFLEQKVAAGELGMSTGRGFREWTPQQCAEVRERLNRYLLALAHQRKDGA